MRTSLVVFGLAVQACSTPALANEAKAIGASAQAAMPMSVSWSVTDQDIVERAKTRRFANDGGTEGWGLEYVSLHSSHKDVLPLANTRLKVHVRHAKLTAWHTVASDTVLGAAVFAGTASRLDRTSAIFPGKTKARYAGMQLAVAQGGNWRLRSEWFFQGGWGGRSLEADAIRMTNGEPPRARGVRATLEVPIADTAATLSLEADVGSRALAPGQAIRHRQQVGLGFTTSF
ncbi:hypothetical protein [Novosphingobium malaysiense]|nr:hypothetical protein [Novosphingobium malaysiense]